MTFFYKVLDNEFYKHKNEIYINQGYSPLIICVSVGAYVRVCVSFTNSEIALGNKNLEVRTKKSELRSRKLEVGSRN